jgi:hypothetical protein
VASKEPAASPALDKRSRTAAAGAAGLRRGKMIAKEMAGKLVPEGLMKSARGASGGAKTIRKQAVESAAPEILLMKTKGESPASKMIRQVAVASLNRERTMSRMGLVGAAALPRKKTIPTA